MRENNKKSILFLHMAAIGFVCTAIAYSLYVSAQKGVRAQTAGIISGMETVYGIIFAFPGYEESDRYRSDQGPQYH